MMSLKLYLDTSVLGAAVEEKLQPIHWIEPTRKLIAKLRAGHYSAFISDLTLDEIGRADARISRPIIALLSQFPVQRLVETKESISLAREYVKANVVTAKYFDDARHIALATLHSVDALVSWNFRHMVNLSRIRRIHSVNIAKGLPLLALVSPQEVVYE